jgi:amino acid adenylation domain-containing protein
MRAISTLSPISTSLSSLAASCPKWNGTGDYPRAPCIPELVARWALATPDALAVSEDGTVLTYRDLDARANQLAHRLRALGARADSVVGLCIPRSSALIIGALGILKTGAAYVALDTAWPADRLAFLLKDAQAPLLVTQQSLVERISPGPWRVVALDSGEPGTAHQTPEPPQCDVAATDLAYVIYTSGSTGEPKGVEITHDSLLNLVYWHQCAFEVTVADRATALSSPGFDASVWEIWPYLAAGASLHIVGESARNQPEVLRDWLVQNGITISFVPTPLAERLMRIEWPAQTPLRVLLTGADTLHHHPRAGLPFAVVNNYGPTECTVVATSGLVPPSSGEQAEGLPAIGRPIANTQIHILDEHFKPVPTGTAGEIHIGGVGVARGYRNRAQLTAEKFIPNPFSADPGARLYRTGDLGRYLQDGQIAFQGRVDDQIKIRGHRIEPQEIAALLERHSSVEASAVVASENGCGERRLVAYLVTRGDLRPAASELRDFLRAHLPAYMVPGTFVHVQELPLTSNGKVDRAALPSPDAENALPDDQYQAPRTPVEERLAAILAGLLGIERVGLDDNFFHLGGHSLLGAQVIARVRDRFAVELSLRSLFDHPTVAEMSREIEGLIFSKLEGMSEDEVQRILGTHAGRAGA